jgi:hypothetical protein
MPRHSGTLRWRPLLASQPFVAPICTDLADAASHGGSKGSNPVCASSRKPRTDGAFRVLGANRSESTLGHEGPLRAAIGPGTRPFSSRTPPPPSGSADLPTRPSRRLRALRPRREASEFLAQHIAGSTPRRRPKPPQASHRRRLDKRPSPGAYSDRASHSSQRSMPRFNSAAFGSETFGKKISRKGGRAWARQP